MSNDFQEQSDFFCRQMSHLSDSIANFQKGQISLASLVLKIQAIEAVLTDSFPEMAQEIFRYWTQLEEINAIILFERRSGPVEMETEDIAKIIDELSRFIAHQSSTKSLAG